ncbi:hypothetical protein WA158_004563 [Blastocystis sp. Blastoise]
MSISTLKFLNGYTMPSLGLGTYLIQGHEGINIIYQAIKLGYRSIDTASMYSNEKEVGQAIQRAIVDGIVKREDLFVTTKLYSDDLDPRRVSKAFERSKKNLQLDYIDLYLIHQPYEFLVHEETHNQPMELIGWNPERMANTWKELEKLVEKKEIRNIGISNFTVKKMKEFLPSCTIMPVNLQIELHPLLQQWETLEYCKQHNITVTAYFPLGNEASDSLKPLKNSIIRTIAKNHNKTPAQIVLRWGIQRGSAVIPKTMHNDRLIENMNILDFELTEEEMNKIKQIDKGKRLCDFRGCLPGDNSLEKLWDGEYCN